MNSISVPLLRAKTTSDDEQLRYHLHMLESNQRRLIGRFKLEPDLDFHAYLIRAVIDFVHLRVSFGRKTQPWTVKKWVDRNISGESYVVPVDPEAGNVARTFVVEIRDPTPAELVAICGILDEKFGLEEEPRLEAIEVSVDFTPRTPDRLARAKMVKTLMHSFMPTRDVHEVPLDRPRSVVGKGRPDYLIYRDERLAPWRLREFRLRSEKDQPAPVDGTFYAGAKNSACFWRIMDKVLDQQNPMAGTRRILKSHERRARIEVSMKAQELKRLGLLKLSDIRDFSFSTLQGSHFNFFLPTFHGHDETLRDCIEKRLDRRRMAKFVGTGVVGLDLHDRARAEQLDAMRTVSIHNARGSGLLTPAKPRVGSGKSGRLVAYAEMNRAVSKALEDLDGRLTTDFERARRTFGDVWFMKA